MSKSVLKMKKEENRNYYINIADWMIDYDLSANELLTYAIVYGYNQTSGNCYWGSTATMADLIGIKQASHACEYLNNLEKKGFLYKEDVKISGKQNMCKYYVTTSYDGKVEDQNVDYLNIQPWMFKKLKLKGCLLFVYARIQNLSKSRSVYVYDDEDLAFWARCDKKRIRAFVNELKKQKLITDGIYKDIESYCAVIPDDIQDSKIWNTSPKTGEQVKNTPKNGTDIPKNGNNTLYNLENNNLIYIIRQNSVNTNFDIESFQKNENIQIEICRKLEADKYSKESLEEIIDTLKLVIKTVDAYNYYNIKKINKFSSETNYQIYLEANKLINDNKVYTPEKILASRISNYLKSTNKEG